MVKLLFRFSLILGILFVDGCDQLCAHITQENTYSTTAKNLTASEEFSLNFLFNSPTSKIKSTLSRGGKEEFNVAECEDKSDALISLKKPVEISNLFTAFDAKTLEYLGYTLKRRLLKGHLSSCNHFPYSASDSYIILQTFRI